MSVKTMTNLFDPADHGSRCTGSQQCPEGNLVGQNPGVAPIHEVEVILPRVAGTGIAPNHARQQHHRQHQQAQADFQPPVGRQIPAQRQDCKISAEAEPCHRIGDGQQPVSAGLPGTDGKQQKGGGYGQGGKQQSVLALFCQQEGQIGDAGAQQ